LAGNPKEEIAYPEARKKTLMCLLQLALVVQSTQSEANDPIPEEEGISIRIVSFGCASSAQEGEALESLHDRAGHSGFAGSPSRAVGCDIRKTPGYRRADEHLQSPICWTGLNRF
jgi:hypothetical protein